MKFIELSQKLGPSVVSENMLIPRYSKSSIQGGGIFTNYYIGAPMMIPSNYAALCTDLYTAKENDVFRMIYNSPGGDVSIGQMVADAIKNTRAKVLSYAAGMCASCCAICWSLGDELSASDFAMIMFHMSSHADRGKTVDVMENAQQMMEYCHNLYKPVLERNLMTQEEYQLMITKRVNIFISGKEMQRRLVAQVNQAGE